MIRTGEQDIRNLVYPYYYRDIYFSDEEIAESLYYVETPVTRAGQELQATLERVAREHADDESPVTVVAFDGDFMGKHIRVSLYEHEPGAKLLGRAATNEVWVSEGVISGESTGVVREQGVKTPVTFIGGITHQAARLVERTIEQHGSRYEHRWRMVKRPTDVNFDIPDLVREYLTSTQKKMNVKGPVFVGFMFEELP
jgi:O-phosphoseryl-tRNA synthetase